MQHRNKCEEAIAAINNTNKIRAFTRDPHALFLQAQTALVPRCRGIQPVSYKKAILRPYYDADKTNTPLPLLHEVVVDWQQGGITVYLSASDAINHVPTSSCHKLLPECQAQLADVYVRETFEFFNRGHSLFHGECRCMPALMSQERLLQLGLASSSGPSFFCRVGSRLNTLLYIFILILSSDKNVIFTGVRLEL